MTESGPLAGPAGPLALSIGKRVGVGNIAGVDALLLCTILAITALSGIALKTLKDFDTQRGPGRNPVFDPVKLEIKHVSFWEEMRAEAGTPSRTTDPKDDAS